MDCLAQVVRGFIAPLWAAWERSPYLRHYRRLLYTQLDPPEAIQERQWTQIGQLLAHAYDTTPFWQERLGQAGMTPGRIRSPEDLRRVPLLRKQDLRARVVVYRNVCSNHAVYYTERNGGLWFGSLMRRIGL